MRSPRRPLRPLALTGAALVVLLTVTACRPGRTVGGSATPRPTPTVWLCRPTHPALDPCDEDLQITSVAADGSARPVDPPSGHPAQFACFYVYPTTSREPTDNSDLRIQPQEIFTARAQAAPFSADCSVWAPMYHQVTLQGLGDALRGKGDDATVAYDSVRDAFRSFLSAIGPDEPIIFIGHSQGTAMLIRLLRAEVDNNPALRSRVVSALLLGGNVTVANGQTTGGTFRHLPVCTHPAETGCVIAYSTFGPATPPTHTVFGRPGQGISLMAGQKTHHGVTVACTNPTALGNPGPTGLDPLFTTQPLGALVPPPEAHFVTFPGLYSAECRNTGGASWLQVTASASRSDHRPRIRAALGPDWGYHQDDVNLAQINLLADVQGQEDAWLAAHP